MRECAVVVIGRNEGERLKVCLRSVLAAGARAVYVDSGSTDDSVAHARSIGVEVVALDMSRPFTAARARNAGWARAREVFEGLRWVQFVDGDCELQPGWLPLALDHLQRHARVAAVCGRLRERFPERSVYNRLCDIEWSGAPGDIKACGGIFAARAEAIDSVGGFREDMIAGEEPELCVRLRAEGWSIRRLDAEMALHDAAMTRFAQWWRRTRRAGYAFALGAWLHGGPPERHWVKESLRSWIWGGAVPLVALAAAVSLGPAAAGLVLLAYPLQAWRIASANGASGHALLHATFTVLGKFPELTGQLQFLWHQLTRRQAGLIEYK